MKTETDSQMDQRLTRLDRLKKALAIFAGAISLITYVVYEYYYICKGVYLHEQFFISTTFSISTFSFLTFTYLKGRNVKSFLLIVSGFYFLLNLTYLSNWVLFGNAHISVTISLIVGLIIALIYFLYDTFRYP